MYLLAKSVGHRPYRNEDINFFINSCIDALEKARLAASIRILREFLNSGIPIHNSVVPDTAGRKTRKRRRTQTIVKRFVFHGNTKNFNNCVVFMSI